MSQEDKLKAIISKAVGNGWTCPWDWTQTLFDWFLDRHRYNQIIFSHDFAKAFWGDKDWLYGWNKKDLTDVVHWGWFPPGIKFAAAEHAELITGKPAWQYHLQQLALTPDNERLDFLYKYVKNS